MIKLVPVLVDPTVAIRVDPAIIPAHITLNVAQTVSEAVHKLFADPAIQADYERWKTERAIERNGGAADVST